MAWRHVASEARAAARRLTLHRRCVHSASRAPGRAVAGPRQLRLRRGGLSTAENSAALSAAGMRQLRSSRQIRAYVSSYTSSRDTKTAAGVAGALGDAVDAAAQGGAPPRFALDGANVEVLSTPTEFHECLVALSRSSKERVSLASLYVGTGAPEDELVGVLEQRLREVPGLRVRVVLDHSRGTRSTTPHNSATTLARLVLAGEDERGSRGALRASINFFRMPQLEGWARSWAPARYKEGVAVQHIKAYVFDETVVVTGANLSEDYFTNRQDRYVVFHNAPELADYFHSLIDVLADFSYEMPVQTARNLTKAAASPTATVPAIDLLPASGLQQCLPMGPFGPSHGYQRLIEHLRALAVGHEYRAARDQLGDTVVRPLLQFSPFGIRVDEAATLALLQRVPGEYRLDIASGYFNLPEAYTVALLREAAASLRPPPRTTILTAAPSANGFYQSNGISGALPTAYSRIAWDFVRRVSAGGWADRVKVAEYEREAWTFHAKGAWVSPAEGVDQGLPCVVFVGSPNLGRRSVDRDAECQLMITTDNAGLRQRLAQERDALFESGYAVEADEARLTAADRRVGGWSWQQGAWIRIGYQIAGPWM